jgi:SEC-C motif-containing protein
VSCICGLGPSTEECCERYIKGAEPAPSPEALMRSRYTAYVLGAIDYVVGTHDPATRDQVDRAGAERWSHEAEWDGLEIQQVTESPDGASATVEFTARYRLQGRPVRHHERAEFRKVDGRWMFHDGVMVKPKPMVRETRKVGRNEPCPCGSGEKYKRCCGGQ